MLRRLSIQDVVLIDRLDLEFDGGLCVLTGETGAGKSILLDALGLALGARADAGLLRQGAERARVTATFEIPPEHDAAALLDAHEIAPDDELVLRRVVGADGRSRAFVNDQPVSVGLLRRLGALLVEIQGQFEQQGLLDAATHRATLDAFGALAPAGAETAAAYEAWRRAREALAGAEADLTRARAEEDFLCHAVDELDELAPQPGEEATLSDTRALLQHAEQVLEALNAAAGELDGDGGADAALQRATRQFDRVAERAGGRLDAAMAALDRALAEAAEAGQLVRAAGHELDLDQGRLDDVEKRLFALRAAAREHGVEVDALAELHAELIGRLTLLGDQGDALNRLARDAEAARRRYLAAAAALSAARAEAAARLDAAVAHELPPLKLDKASFATRLETLAEDDAGPQGRDRIAFLVSTNPGSDPAPLARIASGGELSRFLLALKVVLAGVGGATATAVGARLARLARDRQVLVVTHSPQVAALGTHHWQVAKHSRDALVRTDVAALAGDARREEIARMLSGARITDEARAAADRLMQAGAD